MTFRQASVVARTEWAPGLFTLRIELADGPHVPFVPGQFLNLALDLGGTRVRRSYSVASAPGRLLEFYIVVVPNGALSPHLNKLALGDALFVDDVPQGFFTMAEVPAAKTLWLIATGTGLGPFIAMLRAGALWPRFDNVVLVHGARLPTDLGYHDELLALEAARPLRYLPIVTRVQEEEILHGRITLAIENGVLEKAAGTAIDAHCHVMLCGNPAMIADAITILAGRGLRKHRRRTPGHITTEKYW